MAKLARKFLKLFGNDGATSNFGQFGSQTAGAPVNTKDVETIQALQAYLDGWQSAIYSTNKAPFLEDMNALHYMMIYQLMYQFQEGIAEYNASTTYYIGSIVKKTGTSELYKSLTDTNLGNALPSKTDNANWQYVVSKGILVYESTGVYQIGDIVQKTGTAELYQSLTANNTGNALPSQTSTAIWKYLVDLANITPVTPGVESIAFGFAALEISSTTSATVSVSKIPTVDLGFAADMTVYAIPILYRTNFSTNAGAPSAFNIAYAFDAVLSGSGVHSSGGYLNGGSPANSYTLTLTLSVTSTIGQGTCVVRGAVMFIGVKQ